MPDDSRIQKQITRRYFSGVVGEPSDKELRSLLDERVHLLIRINLLENSSNNDRELGRLLARNVAALEDQISRRRSEINLNGESSSRKQI